MSTAAGRARDWPILLAGGLLLVVCLLPFAGSGILNNDEFTFLSHAKRMLAGEVPYRDFFEFIPPVPLWLLAAGFALGGARLATAHWLAAALLGVAAVQLRYLARRLDVGPWLAWLPGFGLVLCLYLAWPCWSHHWVVLPFELGALACGLAGLESTALTPWLAAGLLVGLAGFTLQTDGAAIGLALAFGVLLDAWQRRGSWRLAWLRLAGLAVGAAALTLLVGVTLAAQGALGAAMAEVVRWPLAQYRHSGGINDLPFGTDLPAALEPITALPNWYVRAYLVLFTFGLLPGAALGSLGWLAGWLRERSGWGQRQAQLSLVAGWSLVTLGLISHAGRADAVHVAMAAVPALLFACVGAARVARLPVVSGAAAVRWLPSLALAAFVTAGALGTARTIAKNPERWTQPRAPDEHLVGSPVIQYLRGHMRPTDRMAAMPYGGFFYFYGPPPASRWTLMLPPELGYGSPDEFQAYWAEIAQRRPRFIVIAPWAWTGFDRAVAEYTAHLPPRYHKAGTFQSPQYAEVFPAIIYVADESP